MAIFRSSLNLSRWKGGLLNALIARRVDAKIEAMASGLVGVKSVQRGYAVISLSNDGDTGTVTITSVTVSKSFLTTRSAGSRRTAALTSPTAITITRRASSSWPGLDWQVVEFY